MRGQIELVFRVFKSECRWEKTRTRERVLTEWFGLWVSRWAWLVVGCQLALQVLVVDLLAALRAEVAQVVRKRVDPEAATT